MGIHEAEELLFAEWRTKRPWLVADGVVDEEAYLLSSRKLLFILKEVNDPGSEGGGWDLRKFLLDGGRAQTWDNITRWVKGFRALPEELSWESLSEVDLDERRRVLKSIAVVNLKKTPGGHTTDEAELAKIAEEDKAYLNKQLSIYNPDLIVCCGTSGTFHWLVPICESSQRKSTSRGVGFHEYQKGKYLVEYSHPQARCASNLLYYGLVDALREILEHRD